MHMSFRWVYGAAAVVAAVLAVDGGYDFPAEDLVTKLPGQPDVGFKQFAGYVDVDLSHGRSLFYYFVEAETNPHLKPLTLWLNGGPGCSSIGGGAFTEIGPFIPRGDGRGLRRNTKSWNKVSNLLFVESPAGVGWSYSNTTSDYHTNDNSTARDMLMFMLEWYKKFPKLRTLDLFLTGESYAGHYIPELAILLLNHNAKRPNNPFILKGIALGNPLLRVDRDFSGIIEYLWSHGLMSDEVKVKITKECDFSVFSWVGTTNQSQFPCYDYLNEAFDNSTSYIDIYGILYDKCYPSIAEQELRLRKMVTKMSYGVDVCRMSETSFYLNQREVQKALHANRTNLPYKWSDCSSDDVLHYKLSDQDIDMSPLLKEILNNKIRVFIYSGDQDSSVPFIGTRIIVQELAEDLKLNITEQYRSWFYNGRVGGWTTQYGNFLTFATVRGAAHMVPYSQPSSALHMIKSFLRGHKLPKHK